MKFEPTPIAKYAIDHSTKLPDSLAQLDRETHVTKLMPQMICGELVGGLLRLLSNTLKPKRILEIGTFTGYSAICMAEGLVEGGELITIDINSENRTIIDKYLHATGHQDKVKILTGDAKDLIPTLSGSFDLVFLDGDKESYTTYFEMIKPLLNPNGIIVADNVLWNGKVLDEKEIDKESKGIKQFNQVVQADPEVENVLLPFNDGLMIVRKKT